MAALILFQNLKQFSVLEIINRGVVIEFAKQTLQGCPRKNGVWRRHDEWLSLGERLFPSIRKPERINSRNQRTGILLQDVDRKSVKKNCESLEQIFSFYLLLMVAMVKAGCELAFETMVDAGIKEESAYYESLHEVPLIANLIDRKRLYEMNRVISDTAEYGCYLFANVAAPMMEKDLMPKVTTEVIGKGLNVKDNSVNNAELVAVNAEIRNHAIEVVGRKLRAYMTAMKPLIK